MFDVRCLLYIVFLCCELFFVTCCLLFGVLIVDCGWLFNVFVVCRCASFVVRCSLLLCCYFLSVGCVSLLLIDCKLLCVVVCRLLVVTRCSLFVACCLLCIVC